MSGVKSYTNLKTAFVTAVFTAIFFVFLFIYLGVNVRNYIYEDSKEIAKELSRKAAMETEQYFSSAMNTVLSIRKRVMLVRELGANRGKIDEIFRSEIEQNPIFLGVWTLWEPNAFDAKDYQFRNSGFYNTEGSLGVAFFSYNNQIYREVMSSADYLGSYYQSSKELKKEVIVEPYRWTYSGYSNSFFGTSLSLPIIEDNKFLGVIGIDIDLDYLRKKLNQVRPYKTGYLSLITNSGFIVSHIDSNFVAKNFFKTVNDSDSVYHKSINRGEEITKELISEFTGEKVFRFFYPFMIGEGKPWSMMVEIPIKHATSRSRQLMIAASVILFVGLGLILFLIFNIFDRRRFEQALIASRDEIEVRGRIAEVNERNYREIFNSTSEAIFIYDDESGKILDVNDVALQLYNFSTKNLILSITHDELSSNIEPYTGDEYLNFIGRTKISGNQFFEWQARRSDGKLFWAEISLRRTQIGGQGRVLAVVRDITEKKKTAIELEVYRNKLEFLVQERTEELAAANEELIANNDLLNSERIKLQETLTELQQTQKLLIQSEKMASLGVLAAGVAHEINNPLNFIHGGVMALESILRDVSTHQKEELIPLLDTIQVGVKRVSNIIEGLNRYTQRDDSTPVRCDIHTILNNCLLILENQIKTRIEIQKDYSKSQYSLIGNEGKLHQVFLNIITNAVQSIEGVGKILLTTAVERDKFIVLIADSGCGISDENIIKITDPFFTTRSPGQGTGLGLAISYSIIQEHGGKINFESKLGVGTKVIVSLPLA